MNERIRELDEAAQEYAGRIAGNDEDSNYVAWFNIYKEKFAELIVRESASIDFYRLAHIGTEDDYNVTRVIREHFGVE